MSEEEAIVALAFFITSCITIVSVARMWFSRATKSGGSPKTLAAIEERMGRMEQAIDAIAVEVERISEGQRFTTRLLAERVGEPPSLPAGDRSGRER
jgi:hypothetical protein